MQNLTKQIGERPAKSGFTALFGGRSSLVRGVRAGVHQSVENQMPAVASVRAPILHVVVAARRQRIEVLLWRACTQSIL